MDEVKTCSKCLVPKPLTDEFFYRARPTTTHRKGGWQSHCKECWRTINRENKKRLHSKGT